jgi:hypothetical protein
LRALKGKLGYLSGDRLSARHYPLELSRLDRPAAGEEHRPLWLAAEPQPPGAARTHRTSGPIEPQDVAVLKYFDLPDCVLECVYPATNSTRRLEFLAVFLTDKTVRIVKADANITNHSLAYSEFSKLEVCEGAAMVLGSPHSRTVIVPLKE